MVSRERRPNGDADKRPLLAAERSLGCWFAV